jgi:hypothetical protein
VRGDEGGSIYPPLPAAAPPAAAGEPPYDQVSDKWTPLDPWEGGVDTDTGNQ